jgi:hypothetical protein
MNKTDPVELAHKFMSMNVDDFRMFWTIVGFEWNQEDGDIEAGWFYFGQKMKPRDVAVISAMHTAVASGVKSGMERDR